MRCAQDVNPPNQDGINYLEKMNVFFCIIMTAFRRGRGEIGKSFDIECGFEMH